MIEAYKQTPTAGIARRLIILIIIFSAAITLIITLFQLFSEYKRDLSLIDSRFEQIKDANLRTLTNALWVADILDMRTQLQGLLRLPDMQYLEIRDQHRVWAEVGQPSSNNTISHTYTMLHEYRGQTYNIGTLKVVATLNDVYSSLFRHAIVILVSNGIKTFFVAGFIVYIFQYLVTRHIVRIAEFAGNMDLAREDKVLKLDRAESPNREKDELGILVSAINTMQKNLRESFEALRQNENLLKDHKAHLEEQVAQRTASLEEAQSTLIKNERLAALGQLTATVSHELRNPLNAMQPSLYIIRTQSNASDTKIQESVDRIERNLKRCDRIIDELLDFTRITTLETEKCAIDNCLRDAIGELELDPKIKLHWALGLSGVVQELDVERMRRALTNIVNNAAQAMLFADDPGKDERDNILTIRSGISGDRVEIRVEDTGPGIAVEDREKIFEPLFSTKNFGVGLGMTIVKQIMELHKGGVEIETEPGKGTTVCLWLPKNIQP